LFPGEKRQLLLPAGRTSQDLDWSRLSPDQKERLLRNSGIDTHPNLPPQGLFPGRKPASQLGPGSSRPPIPGEVRFRDPRAEQMEFIRKHGLPPQQQKQIGTPSDNTIDFEGMEVKRAVEVLKNYLTSNAPNPSKEDLFAKFVYKFGNNILVDVGLNITMGKTVYTKVKEARLPVFYNREIINWEIGLEILNKDTVKIRYKKGMTQYPAYYIWEKLDGTEEELKNIYHYYNKSMITIASLKFINPK
tara:strand:+ start:425 stop:1162 length:738 start_codon:yes stop_codon:yes gene_type:complete